MGNRVLSCIYSPLANRQAPQLFQPICLVKTSRTITTAINITMLFSKTAVLARESCYLFTDGSLVCMDFVTGDYHDDSGNSGNAISGDYTEVSGSATTALDESSTFLAQETGSSASG